MRNLVICESQRNIFFFTLYTVVVRGKYRGNVVKVKIMLAAVRI